MTNILQTTLGPPRADLDRNWYETIIAQKGRRVIFEKGLVCPCKSKSTNAQSNCKNCGGSGWIFINPKETRMIITGLNIISDVKAWSEESRGTINISCSDTEELTFMDKLTLIDANSIYQETVHLKRSESGDVFAFTAYPIKKILYAGLFVSETTVLTKVEDTSITLDTTHLNSTLIKLDPSLVVGNNDISLTLRYKHAPVYHVLEMRRETMQSFQFQFMGEQQQSFPLSAIGRRAHYMTDQITLNGETLLDNSFDESLICDDNDVPFDVCDVIISRLTGQQRECLKSTFRNTDSTFFQDVEVASEGILEDTTISINVNGVLVDTVEFPSMIDQTININM